MNGVNKFLALAPEIPHIAGLAMTDVIGCSGCTFVGLAETSFRKHRTGPQKCTEKGASITVPSIKFGNTRYRCSPRPQPNGALSPAELIRFQTYSQWQAPSNDLSETPSTRSTMFHTVLRGIVCPIFTQHNLIDLQNIVILALNSLSSSTRRAPFMSGFAALFRNGLCDSILHWTR